MIVEEFSDDSDSESLLKEVELAEEQEAQQHAYQAVMNLGFLQRQEKQKNKMQGSLLERGKELAAK